ncbi:unnamed protein product, partial [marine sediment metagenome]
PYIRGANDYGLIIKLMEEKKIIENQKEFDKYRKSVDFDFETFHQEFYKERDRLQELDFKAWFNLEPSYPKIVEGIKQLLERGTRIISFLYILPIFKSKRLSSKKIFFLSFINLKISIITNKKTLPGT